MWTCQNFFLTSSQNISRKPNETHTQSSKHMPPQRSVPPAEIQDVTPQPPPSPSVFHHKDWCLLQKYQAVTLQPATITICMSPQRSVLAAEIPSCDTTTTTITCWRNRKASCTTTFTTHVTTKIGAKFSCCRKSS